MSDQQNRAVVIHRANDVRVEERPEPVAGTGQVQVQVELGGICGSDLSYYKHGAVGAFKVKRPMILGHEVVGTVRAIGAGVDSTELGQRVAVDPSSPCGSCARCREGRPNVCLAPVFLGSASTDPHTDGGFSSLLVTGGQNLVEIPAGVASNDVVFAEPLAVTLHAIERANGVAGKRVLVVGAGPIGAMCSAASAALGAQSVTVTDLDADRLAVTARMGAIETVVAGSPGDAGSVPGFDPVFDTVFEASGSGAGITTAIEATRKGGTLVVVGLPHGGQITVPVGLVAAREMDMLGSFRFCHDEFERAVQMLGDGLDLSPLRTDSFGVGDAAAAFERAAGPASMKVQLDFTDDVR